MKVDPVAEDIRTFLAEDDGQPVVMLNLLCFDGEEGRNTYIEYSGKTLPHLQRVEGEVLYFGAAQTPLVPDGETRWDAVMLVRYPSRTAFLEMVADPEYQEISKLRTRALKDAVLQPTHPWSGA
ncbi:MAG: DUF1330 domain-containing protein [Actinomycetota bacterium]|nr:DUF1330 domain-containing protein [Actinomycetota bacterium]